VIVKPRIDNLSARSICASLILMGEKFGSFRLKDTTNSLHFDGLSWNLFLSDQSTIELVTSCRELFSA
jgi:hypothetical protein